MEQEKIYGILQDCNNQNPQDIVKKMKNEEGLIKSIIENLSCHYKKQVSHPLYSTLFQLYRSNEREARCFVLQFVPPLIWIYLSAMTRRDKQGYGKLEAIFLAIFNTEAEKNAGQPNSKTFRLPSLSRSSIYHESSLDVTSQSALTESALSRHELNETNIPGPKKQLNRITASNRMSVLQVAVNQYNKSIAFMDKASHKSFWLMAYRIAISGFPNQCSPEPGMMNVSAEFISNEEQAKLTNHPRIPLSADLIQELIHGLYYLMYNGYGVEATAAVEKLHYRAAHSLLAQAHVLTNAVHHSLTTTGGLPHNGPLGLQVKVSDSHAVPASPDFKEPLVALATKGMSVAPHDLKNHSDRNDEIPQIDGAPHPEKILKDKVLRTHVKSSSTGHWKMSLHPYKIEYELETLPSKDTLKEEITSVQNIDRKTTAVDEGSDDKACSTKF
ncbi:protein FAM126B-like [Actinia tenebrosa]|uniref:Protein FAM126B-like n=1 Tax=Actinia tenebrosa TaxID=6105 RepID=A0A6P8I8K2_ACTTE|nr:protein FAM126B-like [Actinia tenebrosa]